MHELGERRRLSFGSVAEQYDRIRPSYPEQLVDDVIAYAGDGLTAAGRALEVGAGTGKATLQFAARGLRALVPSGAELRRYDWAKRYGAAECIELVGTDSDHLLLDAGERLRLFGEITEVIGAAGGSFELPYGTLLCLARRRP